MKRENKCLTFWDLKTGQTPENSKPSRQALAKSMLLWKLRTLKVFLKYFTEVDKFNAPLNRHKNKWDKTEQQMKRLMSWYSELQCWSFDLLGLAISFKIFHKLSLSSFFKYFIPKMTFWEFDQIRFSVIYGIHELLLTDSTILPPPLAPM